MSQEPPVQGLVAKDLQGFKWHFRHIYRGMPTKLISSGSICACNNLCINFSALMMNHKQNMDVWVFHGNCISSL